MNYGLIEVLQDLREYVNGNNTMPWVQFRPDGDWRDYAPTYENQTTKLGDETNGCRYWGTLNQIEIMEKYRYRKEPNYSERFPYLMQGKPYGAGDPQQAYETIREHGLIDEWLLPMTDTYEEYIDESDITGSLKARGQNWVRTTKFQHEWLWRTRPNNWNELLLEALKTSPIAISVYAWEEENGVYISRGTANNHWCTLLYIYPDGRKVVLDSYDHNIKTLSKDHNIKMAKRIWLQKKTVREMRKDIKTITGVVEYLKSLLMEKKDILYYVSSLLGTDVSPRDLVPDDVGCAESLSNLERKVDSNFPIVTGTYSLLEAYQSNPKFKRVTVPSPGTRIICATEPNKPFPGHAGVFCEDMTIASNDSRTGKFLKNYTLETWVERYVKKGGYIVHMYDLG